MHEGRCAVTPAIPEVKLTESPMFLAGKIAGRRGWVDATLALPADLEELAPSGPPVVAVMAAAEVTTTCARLMAAIAGAGRSILLVTPDGEIDQGARQWLGQQVEVVPLKDGEESRETQLVATSAMKETVPRPPLPPSGGDYCEIGWSDASAPAGGGSAVVSNHLTRLIDDLHLQGVRDGLSFAAQMPSVPAGISSWIEFSAAGRGGREFLVIETPIGAAQVDAWTQEATKSFAWHVVRWCEQPSARDIGKRQGWFRRSTTAPAYPVPQSECFPGSLAPIRRLSTAAALVAFRHDPAFGQEPVEPDVQTPVSFEYWLPVQEWSAFKPWAMTAVTSLLRMLHLLHDPAWADLPGRNPVTEATAVEQLKESLGFSAYGDLAANAFDQRYRRIRTIALTLDDSMTEAEYDALDLVERPLSPGPPLNPWPIDGA